MKEICKHRGSCYWYRLLIKYHTQRLKRGANKVQLKWVKKLLNNKKVFFDIGANKGLFTYWAAKYIKKNGIFHLFEPQPELAFIFANLEKHFSTKHKLYYNNFALSDSNGEAILNRQCIGDGSASVAKFKQWNNLSESISLQTLDQYCVDHSINEIDFIKIDVEGHEYKTIEGGMQTIQKFKPSMLIEMNPGDESNLILENFRRLGYKIKMIWAGNTYDENSKNFDAFESKKQIPNSHADFLFFQ